MEVKPVGVAPLHGLDTRWQKGADENEVDQASVYGGGETGYTDYPFLQD